MVKKTGRDMVLVEWFLYGPRNLFSRKNSQTDKPGIPDAKFIAHPECEAHILEKADYIGSTTGLLKYTQSSEATEFIVATESGILHQMQKASPQQNFYTGPSKQYLCLQRVPTYAIEYAGESCTCV